MLLNRSLCMLLLLLGGAEAGKNGKKGKKAKGGKKHDTPNNGQPSSGSCDDNGYEVWRQADPADINMELDYMISEDGCGYDVSVSFTPPTNLPGEDFIGKVLAPPANFDAICNAEGRPENDEFPVREPGSDHHVGLNDNFAEFTYTMEVPREIERLTGYNHVTVGAAPCGTFLQPVPHYNVHFYRVSINDRKKMRCVTEGGFFCKKYEEQCSAAGRAFNMDGSWPRCEESFGAPQNVPASFVMTDDFSAVGTNAASAGMGLHGLNPLTLPDQGGDPTMPNRFAVTYDKEISADHVVFWAGFPLGFGTNTTWEVNTDRYNCLEEPKYSSLPKKSMATTDGTTTTITMSGTTNTCATIPAKGPCGRTSFRVAETFNFLKNMLLNDESGLPPDGPRYAGDFDTWNDDLFLFLEAPKETYTYGSAEKPAKLLTKVGRHAGKCTWVGDFFTQHCEGTMFFDHPDVGHGSITIVGATPIQLGDFAPYNPEVRFSIVGGAGDFVGAYGYLNPGIIPFVADPFDVSPVFPAIGGPLVNFMTSPTTFLSISYGLEFSCRGLDDHPSSGKSAKSGKKGKH